MGWKFSPGNSFLLPCKRRFRTVFHAGHLCHCHDYLRTQTWSWRPYLFIFGTNQDRSGRRSISGKMMDGASQGRQSLCFVPAPPCPLRSTSERYLSQHISMHRNPECLKPPVSMPIKVQQFHERGCHTRVPGWRQDASLALGSRCLTRAFVTQRRI